MSENRRMPSEFEMPSLRLDGRVALFTGGSRGLGLGMALALAHAGADIALAARSVPELKKAVDQVQTLGRSALSFPTDVSDTAAIQKLVRGVADHFGRLDIL